jgi:DNA polymerase-3 subunit epsilon
MEFEFISIDLETANSDPTSICDIAFVRYSDGKAQAKFSSLIRPQGDLSVSPINESIHGISEGELANAPSMGTVWPLVLDLIGDLPIVGHNVTQDLNKLLQVLAEQKLQINDRDFYCTLTLARNHPKITPEGSYRLEDLADALNVKWNESERANGLFGHSAESDAQATGDVFVEIARHANGDLVTLLSELNMKPGRLENGSVVHGNVKIKPKLVYPKKMSAKDFLDMVANFSDAEKTFAQGHPLNGKRMLLTLSPEEINENQFWLIVGLCGGVLKTGVSKNLDILVEFEGDPTGMYTPGQTGKSLEARRQNDEGTAAIQFLNERQFLDLVGPEIIDYVRTVTE